MISEFGEERILCCSCDPIVKDTSVIQAETTNLQQRVNTLTQEVRSSIPNRRGVTGSWKRQMRRCQWEQRADGSPDRAVGLLEPKQVYERQEYTLGPSLRLAFYI